MHPKDTTSFLLTWFMTEIIYAIKRRFSESGLTQAGTKSNNASNEGKRTICVYASNESKNFFAVTVFD